MVTAILVDGREVDCGAEVRADKHLSFKALGRRTETRAIVCHFTGGSGLAEQVHRTLVGKGYSIHFVVEPSGLVWQMADTQLRCAHAGAANGWSIGIEVVNHATPKLLQKEPHRDVVTEHIHGRDIKGAAFTEAQTTATKQLVESLCRAYGLPVAVPMDGDDVLATVMDKAELAEWRGVLGHLHLKETKRDPGLRILRDLAGLPRG